MVSQSKINDPRFWKKWRDSGAVECIEDAYSRLAKRDQQRIDVICRSQSCRPYLDEFLEAGISRIGIFVWDASQIPHAQVYVDNNRRGRGGDIAIIVDDNPEIITGEFYKGRRAITYHFG